MRALVLATLVKLTGIFTCVNDHLSRDKNYIFKHLSFSKNCRTIAISHVSKLSIFSPYNIIDNGTPFYQVKIMEG